ncbi:MAG TPA: hypothetical protein VLX92_19705 [Kofleriaceae bacterium]|nr:hypothetical protein [Kofleriaceae bacterium]
MRIAFASLVVAAAAHAGPLSKMAPLDQYLIADRDAEIALARSAAPPSISNDATVLVLTRHGYETAVAGKNGFVCFVDRSWQKTVNDPDFWNPKMRAPTCVNAPAARSVLPFQNLLTGLALSGATREQIAAKLKATLAARTFAPEAGAMAYMMSKQQHLNDGANPAWHSHVMLYLPGTIDSPVLGANLEASPVLGGASVVPGLGTMPYSVYFIPVDVWSDGTPAPPVTMAHH